MGAEATPMMCVGEELASELRRFAVDVRLDLAVARHGVAGETCLSCGTWRWMPVPTSELPFVEDDAALGGVDAASSPEWFGAGHQSYRQMIFRRELAELLAEASPKDFKVLEAR